MSATSTNPYTSNSSNSSNAPTPSSSSDYYTSSESSSSSSSSSSPSATSSLHCTPGSKASKYSSAKKTDLESDDSEYECEHIMGNNEYCDYCVLCGHAISTTFKEPTPTRLPPSKTVNFEKELSVISIPSEIKQWVIRKSSLAKKQINRMGCRKQILFAYIYLAYLDLEYLDFKPNKLIDILNISKKNVGLALKYASGISSLLLPQSEDDKLTSSLVVISPSIYIYEILEKINKLEHFPNLKGTCDMLLEKNELLYEENPELMALAIVKHYFDILNVKLYKYHSHFKKTQSVIKTCIKKRLVPMNIESILSTMKIVLFENDIICKSVESLDKVMDLNTKEYITKDTTSKMNCIDA